MRPTRAVFFLLIAGAAASAAIAGQFKVTQKIAVEGDNRWDALTVDAAGRRLYIAHGTKINVFDIDALKPLTTISNTPGVKGIAISPALNKGFITQNKTDSVTVFDLKSLKKNGEIPTQKGPDAILFDPASSHIFVFNERSNSATVIDPQQEDVIGTLALSGKPSAAATDGEGRIYVSIEDTNRVAEIDSRKSKVEKTMTLSKCEAPSAIAVDARRRRLFVACANSVMAVVDSDSGKTVSTLPVGGRVEALAFDADNGFIFSSSGDGVMTVIKQDAPDKYHVQESVATQAGARTLAVDPKTRRVFLAAAQYGETPAATPETPRPRAPILPGTFQVIVVGQ